MFTVEGILKRGCATTHSTGHPDWCRVARSLDDQAGKSAGIRMPGGSCLCWHILQCQVMAGLLLNLHLYQRTFMDYVDVVSIIVYSLDGE